MQLPFTLSFYIGRQFLKTILYSVLALTTIAMLIDIVELLRRAAGKEAVSMGIILQMAILKAPTMAEKLLPFAVLIGSLLALTRLTKSQELVIARASGVSVWQFLMPALAVVMALGLFITTVFNPLASVMLLKFEKVEGKNLNNLPSLLSVSSSGLWLRQIERESPTVGEHIIYSLRISQSDMTFSDVIVFTFDKQGKFTERLDAERASLQPGELVLSGVTHSLPGKPPVYIPEYRLATNLKLAHIQDSFASPETVSFWRLPHFIEMLEAAGFSALRHRLYWHSLLASPFLYMGMVMIGAIFSLRLPRLGRIGTFVVGGLMTGFVLYFFTDIVNALGMAGSLPTALAAWAPAGIILMIGAGTLLHLEDG